MTGCNFMLAPMTDRYEDVIIPAIMKLDSSRVWSRTTKMGTVYRGKREDVLDAVGACFMYAWRKDVHMTLTMTLFSDEDEDTSDVNVNENHPETGAGKTSRANAEGVADIHFMADCKFALYPLGKELYADQIAAVTDEAKKRGLYKTDMYGATVIKGDVHELFDYFEWAFTFCEKENERFAFEITMSVNSPTPD